MRNYIPTYQEALEIVKAKGNLIFYETIQYIDDYKISIFNYRLASYNDFINPIDNKDINAKELRGLTYIFNKDNSLYKKFLMFPKFWNINQVSETQYNILKDLKIKYINTKEDGSLISFIGLPNGRIIPKTKAGLDNEQVLDVIDIYNKNERLREFVKYCIDNDLSPLFEYVSFKNKIVLNYDKTDLILLKIRNNINGEFIDLSEVNTEGITIVKTEPIISLEELMNKIDNATGIEGVVITFDNDYMVKYKSLEYVALHRLIDYINREDYIISSILNESIDDVISKLNKNTNLERINYIKRINTIVIEYYSQRIKDVNNLVSQYNGSVKDFSIKYLKNENFHLALLVIKGENVFNVVKNHILKNTSQLKKAKNFIIDKKLAK